MTTTRISVLLPARDCGETLAAAVESILHQSYRDLELIVIDDGTQDGSITALRRDDQRMYILANPGRGIVDALNAGAAVARGELLARMDGDDVSLPERLARQVALLDSRPEVGIVGAQVEIFAEGPVGEGYRLYERWINGLCEPADIEREIFVESPIPHPSAVIRREVFERLGGYRHVPWAEDYDLWLRADAAGVAMAKPQGVLLRWRDHDARLSRRDPRCTVRRFTEAKAHFLASRPVAGRPVVIWGAGPTGAAFHDAFVAHGGQVSAFVDIDPRKIGGRKRGRPVLAPEALAECRGQLVIAAVGARGAPRSSARPCMPWTGARERITCSPLEGRRTVWPSIVIPTHAAPVMVSGSGRTGAKVCGRRHHARSECV
jgi:glycosyltransferase involved in cell wall biosynthesis